MMDKNFKFSWKTLADYLKISERALYRLINKLEEEKVIDHPLKGFPH
jgi:DNA-binding Lrp family transcriptional regulator